MLHTDVFMTGDQRWQAVVDRDKRADGAFVYGVVTTGIYCRPGCPSRRPNRENVRFYDTWQDAEADGLRPCKRCMPQLETAPDVAAEAVAKACRLIETSDHVPSLQELADGVAMSPSHFHRVFKKIVGITPKRYAAEKRLGRVREAIAQPDGGEAGTITDAIYDAGFESSSRFYDVAPAALGMTPSAYRDGAPGEVIHYAIARSYLGWVLVAATDKGICRIELDDAPEALLERLVSVFPKAQLIGDDVAFRERVCQVLAFLDQPERGLALPLDIQGTAFQRRVWAALQEIPVGDTLSYSEVADKIGKPTAARAVARACASNRIAVAIPCHRVVRSDGKLGGYRWGLERKAALLEHERESA